MSYKEGLLSVIVATTVLSSQAIPTKTLSGHLPPAAVQGQPIHRLDGATNLSLSIGLPLRNREALTNLLDQLYDPSSPSFHKFISSAEFAARFGPTEQEYARVVSFLQTNGFAIGATHPNRVIVDVTAPVANIEKTFHVHLNRYRHPKENHDFYAPDADPSVELDLDIQEISGLDNFIVPRPASKKSLTPITDNGTVATPLAGSGPAGSYMGNDFRNAYAPGVALTGAGQNVALVQFDGYYPADIAAYRTRAGLPNVPLTNVLLNGISGVGSDNDEVALDIEMVMSMAPGVSNIYVYEGLSGNSILSRIATDNAAKQISASWTFGVSQTTDQLFQQFAAQGQSYFNASGDSDAYVGVIDTPCDSPYITVVGGTTLSTGSSATWSSETVWNWGNDSGTGGGISTRYLIPTWQQGISMTVNKGSSTMRNLPDVAMVADNVFVIADNGSQYYMGGTSVASPLWAAFAALINQQAAARGRAPVGFLNPAIYAIGKGTNYNLAFHDIQTGNNTSSTSPTLFSATSGYDLTTGWGTPKGAGLINLLVPPPAVTAPMVSLTTPSPGAPNVSLTVQSVAGVSYTLQYRNSLTNGTWTSILPAVAGTGGTMVLQDSTPPTQPSRFYRVQCN